MKTQVNKKKAELQHFYGSELCYKIPLLGIKITESINYFANATECFWLITDVSVIAKNLSKKSQFITIDFKRLSEKKKLKMQCEAVINYSDGNGNIFETHKYNITDFPLDELRLFYVNGILMLPSEY